MSPVRREDLADASLVDRREKARLGTFTSVKIPLPRHLKKQVKHLFESEGWIGPGTYLDYQVPTLLEKGTPIGEPLWTTKSEDDVFWHNVTVFQETRRLLASHGIKPNPAIHWIIQTFLKETHDAIVKKEEDRKAKFAARANNPSSNDDSVSGYRPDDWERYFIDDAVNE